MTNLPMKTRSWQSLLRVPRFPAPKKKVAIVVPISSRPELTQGELISLRHLYRFLSGYDIFFIKPPNTAPGLPDDATVIEFPQKYFGSNVAHSLMQMSPVFYEQFIDYEYILMYHLDALVFSDQLEDWCDKGLDYVGAPWFKTDKTPWVQEPEVGNSGFALMNVRSFLRVLYSRKYRRSVKDQMELDKEENLKGLTKLFAPLWAFRRLLPYRNSVRSHIDYLMSTETLSDLFWSRIAKHYYPPFKVATVDEALLFAFETDPTTCYNKTSQQLPFGCHAWEKFDPSFWTPYILPESKSA